MIMSNTHSQHCDLPFLPPGDILVHGGDSTETGETSVIQDLAEYFHEQKQVSKNGNHGGYQYFICIAGNHYLTLDDHYYEQNWSEFHHTKLTPSIAHQAIRNNWHLIKIAVRRNNKYGI